MRNQLDTITAFLKERYKPQVIILVGSRVVGDYKPQSDWDIYLFSNRIYPLENPFELYESLPEEIKKEDLDLYKNSMDEKSYPQKLWRDLRFSKILFDTADKFGEKLCKKAYKLHQKGPVKWTKSYSQGRVIKARRYEKKFEDSLKGKHHNELFLRICYHYAENVIDWWFGIRQEFVMRPQQAFPYIKQKDPLFYKELQKISSDQTSYLMKVRAFKKMHKLLFESQEFKRLVA